MAVLPMKCRRYLEDRGIAHSEREEGGKRAVILHGFPLPAGRYDVTAADILILLPAELSRQPAGHVPCATLAAPGAGRPLSQRRRSASRFRRAELAALVTLQQ